MIDENSYPAETAATSTPALQFFQNDLSAEAADAIIKSGSVAIDTETTGLSLTRDRLCLVQMATRDGQTYFVQVMPGKTPAPSLSRLLADDSVLKLFHYGRFDIAQLRSHTGILCRNVWDTKIASRLVRTYTERHGLKDLVRELLGQEISKQQQTSDWGAPTLSPEQLVYAAGDVIHLHGLMDKFNVLLARENRAALAAECFAFLPARADLDLAGWPDIDIFAHSIKREG